MQDSVTAYCIKLNKTEVMPQSRGNFLQAFSVLNNRNTQTKRFWSYSYRVTLLLQLVIDYGTLTKILMVWYSTVGCEPTV
jgi:hypothetical protein